MAIFTKPKLLFIFFLILSLVLVSQCYDQNPRGYQDPQEKLRECQQRCERQQPGQQKQLCKQRCEQQYRKEQQQQHGGETGEDDLGNVLILIYLLFFLTKFIFICLYFLILFFKKNVFFNE